MKRLLLLLAVAAIGCGGGGEPTAPIDITPRPDTAQSILGFDIGVYPGDGALSAWKYPGSPYRWVGYYLATPCHRDASFVGKRAMMTSMGWGLAAVYVGQQDWGAIPALANSVDMVTCSAALLTTSQGALEAADAVAKMQADGFPDGSIVYLDVEHVTAVSQPLLDYYRAWVAGVLSDGHYKPGVYASRTNAPTLYDVSISDLHGARYTPVFWVVSTTGFSTSSKPSDVLSFAQIWQGRLDVAETWNGITLRIDVDVSSVASPSAPR